MVDSGFTYFSFLSYAPLLYLVGIFKYLCSHNVNINLKMPTKYNRINHFKYTIHTIENILNKMKVYKDIEPIKYNLYKNQLSLIKRK